MKELFGLMKTRLAGMNLHTRLLLNFALVSIIPVLLIGFVSYTISVNVIKGKAMQFSEEIIAQITGEIDNLFGDALKVAVMVADDPSIQVVLRKPLDEDIAKRYSTDLTVDTRLHYIQSSYRQEFFGFYVIGANGGSYKSNFYPIKNGDLRTTDWYQKIVSSDKAVWFGTHTGSFAVKTIGERLISLGFPIIDKATGRKSGVVLIDIEEASLCGITGSRLGETGYIFITDQENRVISHPSKKMISRVVDFSEATANGMGKYIKDQFVVGAEGKSIILSKESEVSGWKVVGALPVGELTKDSRVVGYVIAGSLIGIGLLAFIMSWTVANTVANPINKMMYLMSKVEEGDLSVNMNVKYDDEIGRLGKSFNVMVKKIGILMDKVYEEQKELRKAELRTLQAQINPHFLYNTLDSIIWLSRAKRNNDIDKMVTALTKLFRIGISRGKDIISIGEEIEHVDSYLTIQSIRYKNKFTYEIDVPENLRRYKTLKLVLQPLVENAIYHGIKMKKEVGHISVTGREEENSVVLEVTDTGIGMKKDELQALKSVLVNANSEKFESYGLKNVNERIKIFFGPFYGLSFFSEYGNGTRVEVKIPKILEVEKENVKSNLG